PRARADVLQVADRRGHHVQRAGRRRRGRRRQHRIGRRDGAGGGRWPAIGRHVRVPGRTLGMILRMFPAERSTMSRWLTLCLLALLLAGCGSTPRRELAPDTARTAEALYREGAFARAAQAFLDAAEQHRSRRNWYQLRAAEAWRELGDLEAARAALDGAGRRRLDEAESLRLDLLLAELALDVGNHAHAQDLLTRPHDSVPEAYRARYHDLAARAWEGTDPFTAAAERAWLQPFLLPAERADNLRAIEALLVGIPDRALATRTAALP